MQRFGGRPRDTSVEALRERVQELEETLCAIRAGEVDAIVLPTEEGSQIFALRGSEEPYRRLVERMTEGAAMLDAAGVVLYANRALAVLSGVPLASLTGRAIEELVAPEDRAALAGLLAGGAGSDTCRAELCLSGPGGEARTVLASCGALEALGPANLGFVATDVTEIKAVEKTLGCKTAELERSNEDLQEFAFVASHDLQEPLRKVAIFAELLRGRMGASADEQTLDYLRRLETSAVRMSRLVDSLLDLSRVTTQAMPFEATDLSEVIRQALGDLEVRIRETNARVDVGALPVVVGDPLQLRRLFLNLLSNALKFHAQGTQPCVSVRSEPSKDGSWRVTVEDEGIGFDETHVDRIFKPFQRLNARVEFEGSGMGLAICRKIAARHGGGITARSRTGQGSAFTVSLPANPLANGGRR